ncbi:MAG: succinyldiaminopimelate transaminase [Gammaproteobacteria bacterium]
MNPDLGHLHAYPFEKLGQLMRGVTPPADRRHIALSIGEPKHASPPFVLEALARNLEKLSVYPTTKGSDHLRETIAGWLVRRFGLRALDAASQVLPVNGTREALFSFAQAVIDRSSSPVVVSPNPFYQIYEGAALLAGAALHFVPCTAATGFKADFAAVPADTWKRCQLLYVCSPGNPTGAVLGNDDFRELIELADRHDFVIASDECYSEIHFDEDAPPQGILGACAAMGRDDYARCIAFHSLSKRSNLPGLRSGFVAGDAHVLAKFLHYRTYHGCAMSLPVQEASVIAWSDEAHVRANRDLYREKFRRVREILAPVLDVPMPDAGFYLWAATPVADDVFARGVLERENVTVLPGSFLSRPVNGTDPGAGRVRMALVASVEECVEAAQRIRRHVEGL